VLIANGLKGRDGEWARSHHEAAHRLDHIVLKIPRSAQPGG
jgi:hypothetical protein